jgi:hypothetical protein
LHNGWKVEKLGFKSYIIDEKVYDG